MFNAERRVYNSCQPILKYGFEFVQLKKTFLDMFDLRQNTLLKNVLGVRHKARFKAVLNAIKVEQVSLAYDKHKVYEKQPHGVNV